MRHCHRGLRRSRRGPDHGRDVAGKFRVTSDSKDRHRNRKETSEEIPTVGRAPPHHQVLVTLLLCNSLANEALPIFVDKLAPTWAAVFFSVVFVLVFGEILPSAIFTGPSQLRMAALCAPLVKCVLAVFSPITYPISLLLDHYLPEEDDCEEPDEIVARVEVERELAQLTGTAGALHGR